VTARPARLRSVFVFTGRKAPGYLPVVNCFLETLDQRVMIVSYTANHTAGGDSFAAGKPLVWTMTRVRKTGVNTNYDLAPDGKRLAAFVADDTNGEKPLTQLTFLLNSSMSCGAKRLRASDRKLFFEKWDGYAVTQELCALRSSKAS